MNTREVFARLTAETVNDNEVCAECGRGKGWHDVWCAELRRITVEDPRWQYKLEGFPEESGVTVIRKLEEVE